MQRLSIIKRVIVVMISLSVFSLFCANPPEACALSQRIAVSLPAATHGWTAGVLWWARKAIAEMERIHPGVHFSLVIARDAPGQIKDMERIMESKPDAVVVLPVESAPLTPVCDRIKRSGILTVVVDRGLTDMGAQDIYVCGDNAEFGMRCGEFLGDFLGGRGEIVVMTGVPSVIDRTRVEGFSRILEGKYPNIRILDRKAAYWLPAEGYKLMAYYLKRYPKIDAVWCQDDDVLIGALQAYRESGRNDVRLMLGGGGSKLVVKKILDGDPLVRATITYPPRMIEVALRVCVERITNDKQTTQTTFVVPAEVVTRENAKDHYFPESVY